MAAGGVTGPLRPRAGPTGDHGETGVAIDSVKLPLDRLVFHIHGYRSAESEMMHDAEVAISAPVPVGHPLLRRARWAKRLHAWLLARGNASYERAVAARKRALFGALRGTVVELGAGPGANLDYFDRDVHYVAVEPNPFAHDYLRERVAAAGLDAELHVGAAERLPLADASADAVVCSLVFCTVNDVAGALAEVRRVLKPGGVFAFVEHVAAPAGSGTRALQRALRSPWKLIGDGCHADRDTAGAIRAAGFSTIEIDRWDAPLPAIVRPHISGFAVR